MKFFLLFILGTFIGVNSWAGYRFVLNTNSKTLLASEGIQYSNEIYSGGHQNTSITLGKAPANACVANLIQVLSKALDDPKFILAKSQLKKDYPSASFSLDFSNVGLRHKSPASDDDEDEYPRQRPLAANYCPDVGRASLTLEVDTKSGLPVIAKADLTPDFTANDFIKMIQDVKTQAVPPPVVPQQTLNQFMKFHHMAPACPKTSD